VIQTRQTFLDDRRSAARTRAIVSRPLSVGFTTEHLSRIGKLFLEISFKFSFLSIAPGAGVELYRTHVRSIPFVGPVKKLRFSDQRHMDVCGKALS
jgi:hypothetical protein